MIKSVRIRNFMGYGEFNSQDFAPVNVIIGKNDTGKTGLLKLLYATCKSIDVYGKRIVNEDITLKKLLAEKLNDTFQPGKKGLGELVNKITKEKFSVDVEFFKDGFVLNDRVSYSFGDSTTNTINDLQDNLVNNLGNNYQCLFIPAKEVLTSLKAIRATRDNLHMPGFDDTYLDLIRALVIPTKPKHLYVKGELQDVNKKLEDLFEGNIEQGSDDDFLFKKGNTEFPMQLTAEGVKKIGILTTLIHNRQLNANSILFLDEPETALHPEATRELVEMLMLMANAGIQVFIATHNYFVLKQMHLSAKKYAVDVNCYSLTRNKGSNIESSLFNLREDFPENEIAEEAIKMADEETSLDLGL